MKYLVSIFEWKEERKLESPLNLKKGDLIVVDLVFGKHLGEIVRLLDEDSCNGQCDDCFQKEGIIVRKATGLEKEKIKEDIEKKEKFLKDCRALVKKYKLPMKLVGVDLAVDGGGIIFGFTAEERVDFRLLVRELAAKFQKSVRLQQIGSRDEARMKGGIGPCGRVLCCLSRNIAIQSISTEMARLQQISHRGNERLSGCCNRLMCCLSFEQDTYEKMRGKLPNVGERVRTPHGDGTIEGLKILSEEVGVRLDSNPKEVIWVKVSELRKK